MNTEQSFLKELLIVIVIFEKDPLETTAFQSLNSTRKEAMLLLYDNSRRPHPYSEIKNAIYLHDSSNPGVSKAYNSAGKLAKLHNRKWLIFADQDTHFPDSFFRKYKNATSTFPDEKVFVPYLVDRVGLVSPFKFRNGKGNRIRPIKWGVHELKNFRFANSGLMIGLDLFEAAGGYDERFPLDYSDIVFIDKLAKINSTFILVDTWCKHDFSGSEKIQSDILFRRFTMFCQAVVLYKKISPVNVPLYWVLLPRAIKFTLQTGYIKFLKLAWYAFRGK